MTSRSVILTAACSAVLIIPQALTAQTDTTMRRDTTMRTMQDTTNRMRTMQDTTNRTRQTQTTSQQRLRVQKRSGEAAGTIVDTRADSIANAERMRRDSAEMVMQRQRDSVANIERMRNDSIARIERARADSIAAIERFRADSVARADSIRLAEEERRRQNRFGGAWYAGIGAGISNPISDLKNLGYNSGLNVHVPIGWHRPNSALGVRFDVNYNRFSGRTFTGQNPAGSAVTLENPNPQVLSGTLNLTLATPLTLMRNVRLYALAGGGIYHFRSFGANSALGGYLGNDVLRTDDENRTTRNKFGAQFGGGLDWTVGTSAVYLESRWVNVFANRGDDNVAFRDFFGDRGNAVQWVPIVLGVKIR
jgi:hypothetical protein